MVLFSVIKVRNRLNIAGDVDTVTEKC